MNKMEKNIKQLQREKYWNIRSLLMEQLSILEGIGQSQFYDELKIDDYSVTIEINVKRKYGK